MKPADIAAVVLAGGLGTRLAGVVADRPKPMAEVAGRPFLEYVLDRLDAEGVRRVVLAVGHMQDLIVAHFGRRYRALEIVYAREHAPLGTGGALRQAFAAFGFERAFALNGDTFCTVVLADLLRVHEAAGVAATLSLLRVPDARRYGTVGLDANGRIAAFREKSAEARPGLINAGVYLLERRLFDAAPAGAFSFEQAVLQRAAPGSLAAQVFEGRFIDIGVPEDYRRAQSLLAG